MSKLIKTVSYIDEETGEIISERQFKITDFSVRFKVGSSIQDARCSRFSKLFQLEDPSFDIMTYYGYFYKCLLHLEMFTNRIVYHRPKEGNKPINEKDFEELFKANAKTVKRFLNYCKEKNLIAKISKNDELYGYVVNPLYALNGNKMNVMLYTIFADCELDKHIPIQDLKKLKEYLSLGLSCPEENFEIT